jgi:hypothetical protein
MEVRGEPFPLQIPDNETVRCVWAKPEGGGLKLVEIFPGAEEPQHLARIYVADGRLHVGQVEVDVPPTGQRECTVKSASTDSAELRVADHHGATRWMVCEPELARQAQEKLDQGEQVTVRVSDDRVHSITSCATPALPNADWVEYPTPTENQTIDQLVLFPEIRERAEVAIENLIRGESDAVCFIGPPGIGKTELGTLIPLTASLRSKKPVGLVRFGQAYTGSCLVDQAPQNVLAARNDLLTLRSMGYLPVGLLDEIDAFVGASGRRWEGTHDLAVRKTVQSITSDGIPGVVLIATMNRSSSSWLDIPFQRRFDLVEVPSPTRAQLVRVAIHTASAESELIEDKLGMTVEEFANALVESLREEVFRVHMHSDRVFSLRGHQLITACPSKVVKWVTKFCRDLKAGKPQAMPELLQRVRRELTAVDVNEENFWETTFVDRAQYVHDDVKFVERNIRGNGKP